jgi:hypothetical protein
MAIKLIANYSKRLGLPGFSSHQFSVSVETELTDLGNVQGEASRLYSILQDGVDREIQHVGFVPPDGYGLENGNGADGANGHTNGTSNGNGHWSCSDKQKELILKLVDEHSLDRNAVEDLAQDRFGAGVKMLNKLQASGLITELIETADAGNGGRKNGNGKVPSNGYARKGGAR